MGAERFSVTGRGPSTSCLAIICTDLSHVSLFYFLYLFFFLCSGDWSFFGIENPPCIGR